MAVGKNLGNILFLDFDGVCNSFRAGSYLMFDPPDYGVDEDVIRRIREICKAGNARIVVSSNWRRHGPDDSLVYKDMHYFNPLPELLEYVGDLVFGALDEERGSKAEAISRWLSRNRWFSGRYAILDDCEREGIQDVPVLRKNFWLVDRRFGVTDGIKKKVIMHLKGED